MRALPLLVALLLLAAPVALAATGVITVRNPNGGSGTRCVTADADPGETPAASTACRDGTAPSTGASVDGGDLDGDGASDAAAGATCPSGADCQGDAAAMKKGTVKFFNDAKGFRAGADDDGDGAPDAAVVSGAVCEGCGNPWLGVAADDPAVGASGTAEDLDDDRAPDTAACDVKIKEKGQRSRCGTNTREASAGADADLDGDGAPDAAITIDEQGMGIAIDEPGVHLAAGTGCEGCGNPWLDTVIEPDLDGDGDADVTIASDGAGGSDFAINEQGVKIAIGDPGCNECDAAKVTVRGWDATTKKEVASTSITITNEGRDRAAITIDEQGGGIAIDHEGVEASGGVAGISIDEPGGCCRPKGGGSVAVVGQTGFGWGFFTSEAGACAFANGAAACTPPAPTRP